MCAVSNLFPLANSRTTWRCNFKRLSQHGRQADFSKISAPHSLITTYRMNLILAGSISLDSTFNINNRTLLKPASGFYSGVTSMLSVTKIGFGGKAKPQVISLKTLCAVGLGLRIFVWITFVNGQVLQFLIMPSYLNYQNLCRGSYRKSACFSYFDLFTIASPCSQE